VTAPNVREDPLLPNARIVASREYRERVGSRLFHLSTLLLATLAVIVAFIPLFARAIDRTTTTTIGVVASDDELANRAIGVLGSFLNRDAQGGTDAEPQYTFVRLSEDEAADDAPLTTGIDALLYATRDADGRLDFRFRTGESIGADRIQVVSIAGTLGVAILDWSARNEVAGGTPFIMPGVSVEAAAGPTRGDAPLTAAQFASRRIVGVVFVVLIFITLVIYGMWVAAGVVAEKTSRVMELMISAASPRQLVVGKVVGIGAAGVTQAASILLPALVAVVVQRPLSEALFGPDPGAGSPLDGISFGLLAAFFVYFVLGFLLYALVYAAAGSLVSRAEDLQMLALPLSLVAIVGYVQAVLAMSGGTVGFIRIASYVPFWSPFVMLTRLSVGYVEPWEVALSVGLLAVTIAIVYVVAVRIYAAGVLLYGQRPGLRAIVGAAAGR
jgi:ABC-2 type transport system permease protein